jgi:uncharacterized protein YkwD
LAGACEECGKKRLTLQRYSTNQTRLTLSRPDDQYEQEADRIAEHVTRASAVSTSEANRHTLALSHTQPLIQRQVDDATTSSPEVAPTPAPSPAETAATEEATSAGLIVEDDAGEVGPGQMRKNEFLDQLRAAVCAAADAELARAGRSTESCPYIERAFERYRSFSGGQLERGLRRYAPEAAGATTARDYIPAVSERVRRAVAVWALTGQITDVPEELASELPGAGLMGAFGGLLSGIGGAVSGFVRGIGGIGGMFFKAREDGAKDADPQEVLAQLGTGHPLDGSVKSRMEPAFGHDFSQVRIHTDTRAADLSTSLNARAFTIGSDIAFGAGEYRPGTPTGDALIAHELAHVAQQNGGASSAAPLRQGGTEYTTLEEDADASAVSAVVSIWGGVKHGATNISQHAMPRLKSGLGLQRCKTTEAQTKTPKKGGKAQAAPVPLPNQILDKVNAQRGNLGALRWNNTLAQSAATYCGVMTSKNVFSHTADGSDPLGRVRAAGYFPLGGGGTAGENLYQNPQVFTADDAVTWWMGSPPHRAEIMNPRYEEAGVAVCDGAVNIGGKSRHTNIAVIHFGASHPVLTVSDPTGTKTDGDSARWKITGSVSDNIDPPKSITVQVSLIKAKGGMTVTGLPAVPLKLGASGDFSFSFDTAGKGSADIKIEATDTHGNAPRPETRTVRIK